MGRPGQHRGRPPPRRPHQPQLVTLPGRQARQAGRAESQRALAVRHDHGCGPAAGHGCAHHLRVGCGHHRGEHVIARLRLAQAVLCAEGHEAECDRRGRERGRQGQSRWPRPPRPRCVQAAAHRGRAARMPRPTCPGRPRPGRDRWQLPGPRRLGEYPVPQSAGGRRSRGRGHPGRGLLQPAHLLGAGVAGGQVPLEAGPVARRQRVERVGTRQRVQVGPPRCHHVTPRQSRSLIRPSRIRVFVVPTAIPSRPATSR